MLGKYLTMSCSLLIDSNIVIHFEASNIQKAAVIIHFEEGSREKKEVSKVFAIQFEMPAISIQLKTFNC